jgi:hypothetical protein
MKTQRAAMVVGTLLTAILTVTLPQIADAREYRLIYATHNYEILVEKGVGVATPTGTREGWMSLIYRDIQSPTYNIVSVLSEYDCASGRLRPLRAEYYVDSQHMYSDNNPNVWRFEAPDSAGDQVIQYVCSGWRKDIGIMDVSGDLAELRKDFLRITSDLSGK